MTYKFNSSRRSVLKGTAVATGALAAPAVLSKAWAAEPIKVSSYGGYFEDMLAEYAYPEFTKATGIEVQTVSQPGGFEWFVQLKTSIAAGSPAVDVTMGGYGSILRAPEVLIPIDESQVPNLANVPDYLIQRTADGTPITCPVLAWYATLVTNTELFPTTPTSWADAWDPKFEGELGWGRNIDSSYLLDIVAATFFGGNDIMATDEGLMTCMNKAAELKDNVRLWFRDEGQFQAMLQSGELNGGQYYHDVTQVMIMDGFPVTSTFPKEGGVIDFGSWGLVQGTDKIDACQEFMNWSVSPEAQTSITDNLWTAPVLPRDMLPNLSDESFNRASSTIEPIVPNYEVYVNKGDWLGEKWNELLSGV
ncbi:MAG: extracellular solute-binding protein [Rhodospirillaceae bacterium]|jgi:putative spermidine/putrescine transport system substrate-binding protein|nr:extracellular solute-binding protein [Rhodospirillaceae bacterium]MBT7614113.1 extracellular solute-binding protein [Rhodospirillaceae bacterium]MBT7648933.1 extracellular solute-binding protein [Rhodospirillaceae bacterium]